MWLLVFPLETAAAENAFLWAIAILKNATNVVVARLLNCHFKKLKEFACGAGKDIKKKNQYWEIEFGGVIFFLGFVVEQMPLQNELCRSILKQWQGRILF